MPLDGTERKSILLVGGLVPGEFRFNFTVRDQASAFNTITVRLIVNTGFIVVFRWIDVKISI